MRNLYRKISIVLLINALVCFFIGDIIVETTRPTFAEEQVSAETTNSEDYIPSEAVELESMNKPLVQTTDKQELLVLIQQCEDNKKHAHDLADSARSLGYPEDHVIVVLAKKEWSIAQKQLDYYTKQYNDIIASEEEAAEQEKINKQAEEDQRWNSKAQEYPAATTIWRYFKNLGYNDWVSAGILGNIMTEVGGQTLNIQWQSQGNGYYGICQWNQAYQSQVWGADLKGQLNCLRDTIGHELNTYGSVYYAGFNYDQFLSLNSAEAAALAFAKCYERCGSGSYSVRQNNALTAYNYFTN